MPLYLNAACRLYIYNKSICAHSLQGNKTVRNGSFQQLTYADWKSKSQAISLHSVKLLNLLMFQQNKCKASFLFHSSSTQNTSERELFSNKNKNKVPKKEFPRMVTWENEVHFVDHQLLLRLWRRYFVCFWCTSGHITYGKWDEGSRIHSTLLYER